MQQQLRRPAFWSEGLACTRDIDDANSRLDATKVSGAPGWPARIPDHRWRYPIHTSAGHQGFIGMPTCAALLLEHVLETPGGERKWDYRQLDPRLHVHALQALHWLNLDWKPTSSCSSLPSLNSHERRLTADHVRDRWAPGPPESTRDDLTGYAGARPVRIGNGAFDQRQNDVYGAALDSVLLHTRRSNRLPRSLWPIVQAQADVPFKFGEPDQGILEARGSAATLLPLKLMLGGA